MTVTVVYESDPDYEAFKTEIHARGKVIYEEFIHAHLIGGSKIETSAAVHALLRCVGDVISTGGLPRELWDRELTQLTEQMKADSH